MLDVIIIGAGAAGLSAALWCDELGLDALVLEASSEIGGQLLRVYNPINNYLGVQATDGRALRDLFAAQIEAGEEPEARRAPPLRRGRAPMTSDSIPNVSTTFPT